MSHLMETSHHTNMCKINAQNPVENQASSKYIWYLPIYSWQMDQLPAT